MPLKIKTVFRHLLSPQFLLPPLSGSAPATKGSSKRQGPLNINGYFTETYYRLRWTRKVVHISSFIKIVNHGFSSGKRGSDTQTCKTIVTFECRRSHNIQINCFVAGSLQSRTQSPQALWPAIGRPERPWGLEFYYRRISMVKQCKPLGGTQSKHLNFFSNSQSLSWRPTAGQRT